jgi:four helix bundle protein
LKVWQESVNLVKLIYELTRNFPKSEEYGLTSQLKRAAVSVPSNIAEGSARAYKKEFIQFLYIALGSLSELETQLYIAKALTFAGSIEHVEEHIVNVRKMLLGLIKNLKNKQVDADV